MNFINSKVLITLLIGLTIFNLYSKEINSLPMPDLSVYQFYRTKNLVRFVYDAALKINKFGEKCFSELKEANKEWIKEDKYIFVYGVNGEYCVHPFHEINDSSYSHKIADSYGHRPVEMILNSYKVYDKTYSWVHYLWARPNQINGIFPTWKSTFVMRVIAPSGKVYIVGSGEYNMKIEREFVKETVDDAAILLGKYGEQGFSVIKSASSSFSYQDIFVFIIDFEGNLIVDPVSPYMLSMHKQRDNLLEAVDTNGNYPIKELIKRLKTDDEAWIMYMSPKPGNVVPSKKLLYGKKVKIEGKEYIVASGYYEISPIWMSYISV